MLTTAEASAAILAVITGAKTETVALEKAHGRVLRQSVVAERDQPPFDRVTMDGIALSFAEFAGGTRRFPVQALQAAGDPALTLEAGNCIEIMTGASLPAGADCIVPVERVGVQDGVATIENDYAATARQFVHARGSDHVQGTELLRPGTRISPVDIAIIASCGLRDVVVSQQPTIRVISTGNELVPAGAPIEPHQIRMSNGPAMVALLEQHGFTNCSHHHIVDEPALLRERIAGHLDEANVLILSGGVSMGKADYVPGVLKELGVEVIFHKVSQRPGKPMWFGMGPGGQAVFALPGNPVSSLVCCRQYVLPALYRASGLRDAPPEFASLAQAVTFSPALTFFLPVKLVSAVGGQTLAMPVHTNTSGDFAALTGTAGYVELALEESSFPAGTGARLHRW
ncbi:MAG: molybdopterin molybdotransferase MoeA [Gammaproteobacteria bacterium]|nr:molybdopterin molybdotransferase MoeA [Gammaproteobacteria bacterium]MDH5321662.1 molybdopterin molybdotransferase MoeA [Gammaproteobacteria bacterium]